MITLPILVVEDNAATRKMMRLTLQAEGYAVLEAGDGQTALRLAAEHSPALVFLDCKLPDMDGFELVRQLRALAPQLPVVAVTGWAQLEESRVVSAGFLDVLLKPVAPLRLVEIVERHVGRAPPRSAASGKTVLLAEDEPTQRKLAQLALSSAGFQVVLAEDGQSALRLARERKPDAILSDVLMPGLDGFALCQALRADPALAGLPIVLMSAHYLEDADRELATRFGATRYVSRTAGFDAVLRTLLDALEAPPAEAAAPPTEDLQTEYLRRVARQLERQASIGAGLARQVSLQATALSVLDTLSVSLSRQLDPESALADTLAECLDAAGLSVGAILLQDASGELTLKAHVGAPIERDWSPHAALLLRAGGRGGLLIPSEEAGPAGVALLRSLAVASALVVPIIAREESLGVLVLASNRTDLVGAEGESFVRAARAVSMQLGQALALSRMFAKLSAAEQRYRALLENAHDAIGVLTPDGVLLEANRGWERLLGLPRAALLGRNVADFAADGERAVLKSEFEQAVAAGGAAPATKLQRADGGIVHVELSQTLVDVNGEQYVLSVGRDITDRLRLEEQLLQAQKMEAVGSLAGGVAHDFNNLLAVILSYGELLLGELHADDPMRMELEQIVQAGQRGKSLTRQLLVFSRRQVLAPRILELNEICSGVSKMLERLIGEDVELKFLLRASGKVFADPGQLEQVLMNLVVNARDAMPTGGKLTIETADVALDEEHAREHLGVVPGKYAMLSVSDTGGGIDPEIQARIFEPFFTTKPSGQGTGLGLSTAFGIVKQSGGTIWLYSEPGKGTTFKVYLPWSEEQRPLLASSPASAAKSLRGSETVLLVEDDEQVRLLARNILTRFGYRVLDARSAREALAICEQFEGTIHLLLTDVVMPRVGGRELAVRLSQLRPAIQVIFMSGYTDDAIVRHGILSSSVEFIQKPFMPDAFLTRIREVLDASPGAGGQSP